jgi:hypothetical protein
MLVGSEREGSPRVRMLSDGSAGSARIRISCFDPPWFAYDITEYRDSIVRTIIHIR